jgi:hypothetical protein
MAVMKAVEQGLFTLDADINGILPFKVVHPYNPEIPITIKHLVTHTSGIVDHADTYKKTYIYPPPVKEGNALYQLMVSKGYGATASDTTLGGFLKNYLTTDGHLFKKSNFNKAAPGKRYEYSNLASDLVAYLIEVKIWAFICGIYGEIHPRSPAHERFWMVCQARIEGQKCYFVYWVKSSLSFLHLHLLSGWWPNYILP